MNLARQRSAEASRYTSRATRRRSESGRRAVGTLGAHDCRRRHRTDRVKGLQRDGSCGEMRREADASGQRHERGVGVTAGAAHHALGFALGSVMHRTDLTGSNAGTAFGLRVLVVRRRATRCHRRDTHGGQMACEPDDGDRSQQTNRAHAQRYLTESGGCYARRNPRLGRFSFRVGFAERFSIVVRQDACLVARSAPSHHTDAGADLRF